MRIRILRKEVKLVPRVGMGQIAEHWWGRFRGQGGDGEIEGELLGRIIIKSVMR